MISQEAIEAALEAYAEGVYLTDEQVRASVIRIVEAALPFLPIAGEGKVKELDEEQIAKLIWQHLPSKVAEEMTRDKHPPLFPQAEYTVATLSAKNFVEAIIDLVSPSSPGKDGGQSIAHKDGCDFKHSPITLCDCPASEEVEAVGYRWKLHKDSPWGYGSSARNDAYVCEPLYARPASTALVEAARRATGNGMAIAAAIIMRVWGHSTEATEILNAAGYTSLQKLLDDGVDDYDIEALKPLFEDALSSSQSTSREGER